MNTQRLTTAQALISFLQNQFVERDGRESQFFAGVWGIFGHGNVAGVGQALQQTPGLRYYLARNEQAMVHIATAYAKMNNRLRVFACTSSIGPGATNMITGAAAATINRLPVLLLPGDIFARRNVAPVLQQLESEYTQDTSVNDSFKPVSRYWDRLNRADQLPSALMEAMRVLTSPAETGAVTLALPQDVQAEACDYPKELFEKRVWHIPRPVADRELLSQALKWISSAQKPLIIAGGGVIYSEASEELARLVQQTGIPVGETMAGKGALSWDHPQNLGAMGVTGTPAANVMAREADLVIAIGTRLSDFTTASKTAFQNPNVRFVNINVAEFDAYKHAALPLVADARVTIDELRKGLEGYRVSNDYASSMSSLKERWGTEAERLFNLHHGPPISQSEVIGIVNKFVRPEDVVVCAAGSLPGDLHKLWRTHQPRGYHLEYGYSCMGYEIAGGLGVKMADPERDVYVMVGDGSYLMMSSEIVTSVQEGYKLNIILLNNYGFSSIGGLSQAVGSGGFGTDYRARRAESGQLDGRRLEVDFAANAASLGARAIHAVTCEDLQRALEQARQETRTTVIAIEVDKEMRVPGYESWWDVAVAEVSGVDSVKRARERYDDAVKKERYFL
ncbi:MAG TPA: 3D-(3,5/4)-trihydroxycyclohexane-1,2-dione acylhydrolase (decyclizing) [Pyrinomonadaceae bacterium]|nr:3D-(3,5/4)-trihydroxycyclohexane-1,2-dione acylhydrolase (decyclizing) [Pyrinomonadaceae bacterium]